MSTHIAQSFFYFLKKEFWHVKKIWYISGHLLKSIGSSRPGDTLPPSGRTTARPGNPANGERSRLKSRPGAQRPIIRRHHTHPDTRDPRGPRGRTRSHPTPDTASHPRWKGKWKCRPPIPQGNPGGKSQNHEFSRPASILESSLGSSFFPGSQSEILSSHGFFQSPRLSLRSGQLPSCMPTRSPVIGSKQTPWVGCSQ